MLQADSPVGSIQDGSAVHQDEPLLQGTTELGPGLALVLRAAHRPNTQVLEDTQTVACQKLVLRNTHLYSHSNSMADNCQTSHALYKKL